MRPGGMVVLVFIFIQASVRLPLPMAMTTSLPKSRACSGVAKPAALQVTLMLAVNRAAAITNILNIVSSILWGHGVLPSLAQFAHMLPVTTPGDKAAILPESRDKCESDPTGQCGATR